MSENRKENQICKLTRAYLRPSSCAAQLGQPTRAIVLLAPVGQACGRRARTAVPPRHQPAWLPSPDAWTSRASPRDAHRSLTLPSFLSSLPRSLSRECRAPPSPLLAVAALPAVPSLFR